MLFEWDAKKAAQNVAKHGVPFEYAARVFLDPLRLDSEDTRRDYQEERRITMGKIEGRLFVAGLYPTRQGYPADFGAEGQRTRTEAIR